MKWFDRWFYKKVRWCQARIELEHPEWKAEQDMLDQIAKDKRGISDYSDWSDKPEISSRNMLNVNEAVEFHGLDDGLRIDLKHVNGGYIATIRHPSQEDRLGAYHEGRRSSYIINDDADFDHELCKILSIERLHQ